MNDQPWTLVCGDGIAGLREHGPVDVVITDPPYTEHVHAKSRRTKCGGGVEDRDLGFDALTIEQMEAAAAAIAYTCRRWALVFCAHDQVEGWREALLRHGMVDVKRTAIWHKTNSAPQLTGDRPAFNYESIVIMHSRDETPRWNGGGHGCVFSGPIDATHKIPKGKAQSERHATPKPLWLMRRLVELFTDAGETIADPFAGGATTLVAAVVEGRRAVGWEIQRKNYNIGMRRLANPGAVALEGPSLELPFATANDSEAAGGEQEDGDGDGPGKVRKADAGSIPAAMTPSRRATSHADVDGGNIDIDRPEGGEPSPDSPPAAEDQQYGPAHPFRGTDGIAEACDEMTIPADPCADMEEHAEEIGRGDDWPGPDDKIGPECFGGQDFHDFDTSNFDDDPPF